jgi:crossover junction endodeoxyribonuclease RuvC
MCRPDGSGKLASDRPAGGLPRRQDGSQDGNRECRKSAKSERRLATSVADQEGQLSQIVRILGVDPGLNTTGYGVIEIKAGNLEIIEAGVIRSHRGDSLEARLFALHEGLTEVIEALQPIAMAVEDLYAHYERPTTAILMGHARGVLCLAAGQAKLPVSHYKATQIKKVLTGNGRAPKPQVQMSVMQQLRLPRLPDPPDVADALAIAVCHYYLSRNPASFL